MSFDTHSIFAISTVKILTSQSASTLIITLQTGDGANYALNQQVILAPSTVQATKANAMIGRITGISGDQLTIDVQSGNREGSNVRTVFVGDIVIGGTITPKILTDIESPLLKLADYVVSGLTIPTSGNLATTMAAGVLYIQNQKLSVGSDGGHTYTASRDTYVDVSTSGVVTYAAVTNGASAPALTANSARVAKVVTNGSAVTSVTQIGWDSNGIAIYPTTPLAKASFGSDAQGDIFFRNAAGYLQRLPTGTNGQYLQAQGASANPIWVTPSSAGLDGWIGVSDTLLYASATSITIIGVDRTAIYTKGTKVKFTNNGITYYGYVSSSSFSANTTVNFYANTVYTVNNSAITAPSYSYDANPQGFPDIFYFASTWTGFSSNPTNPIPFTITGNVCTMLLDHTGTSNSATFNFTLPAACKQISGGNPYLYEALKVYDNNAHPLTMGVLGIPYNDGAGGLTAKVGVNLSTAGSNTFAGFTNSNAKGVFGVVQYPIL